MVQSALLGPPDPMERGVREVLLALLAPLVVVELPVSVASLVLLDQLDSQGLLVPMACPEHEVRLERREPVESQARPDPQETVVLLALSVHLELLVLRETVAQLVLRELLGSQVLQEEWDLQALLVAPVLPAQPVPMERMAAGECAERPVPPARAERLELQDLPGLLARRDHLAAMALPDPKDLLDHLVWLAAVVWLVCLASVENVDSLDFQDLRVSPEGRAQRVPLEREEHLGLQVHPASLAHLERAAAMETQEAMVCLAAMELRATRETVVQPEILVPPDPPAQLVLPEPLALLEIMDTRERLVLLVLLVLPVPLVPVVLRVLQVLVVTRVMPVPLEKQE